MRMFSSNWRQRNARKLNFSSSDIIGQIIVAMKGYWRYLMTLTSMYFNYLN